jgi:uncharacterized protein (DUF1015 family)
MDTQKIPISQIRLDFQPPENLIEEKIEEFVLLLESGAALEPIRVYFDGEVYWLADGFHRVEAARLSGSMNIEAEVTLGTYEDMEKEWQRCLQAIRESLRTDKK